MGWAAVVRIPIDANDLTAIEEMLQNADVFTTTFQEVGAGVYKAGTYFEQRMFHQTEAALLLDRNVMTRLVGLARGRPVSSESRVAAAALAFAQTINAQIEPSMALHEFASTQGNEPALEELHLVRRLDNTHPQVLANIALGRGELDLGELADVPEPEERPNLARSLRRWRFCYTVALKIAELELSNLKPEAKMRALIDWMGADFLFVGPALALAMRYLAPNGRKKRQFKYLRSVDRERAISGVRNAAWDLALISEWSKLVDEQREERCLWLLTTFDRGLREVARSVRTSVEAVGNVEEFMDREFVGTWGRVVGPALHKVYSDWQNRRLQTNGPGRKSAEQYRRLIEELENRVRGLE